MGAGQNTARNSSDGVRIAVTGRRLGGRMTLGEGGRGGVRESG